MIVDGNRIATTLQRALEPRLRALVRKPKLAVVVVHETPQMKIFVALKQQFGAALRIPVDVVRMSPVKQSEEELLRLILHTTKNYDGVIVQLPLPKEYQLDEVLHLYPLSHDVDVIGTIAYQQFEEDALPFMPPVVAAFTEVLHQTHVKVVGKKTVVVGKGRLVGAPAAIWAERFGADVTVVDKSTADIPSIMRGADIVILGAGKAHFLKPDMVKDGVIILDAGSSEMNGSLVGDADPSVAEKASVFTPTPGGIGPITIAKVFENLITLSELKQQQRGR